MYYEKLSYCILTFYLKCDRLINWQTLGYHILFKSRAGPCSSSTSSDRVELQIDSSSLSFMLSCFSFFLFPFYFGESATVASSSNQELSSHQGGVQEGQDSHGKSGSCGGMIP